MSGARRHVLRHLGPTARAPCVGGESGEQRGLAGGGFDQRRVARAGTCEAGEELETRDAKEWSQMMDRFEVRQVALALDEGRALEGATKEIVDELRSAGGYQGIPLPLAALEQRAGETVSADLFSPKATRNIIGRIFPNSVASKLGVASVNIPQGTAEWPVATAGAVTGWQADELSDVGAATAYQTTEATVSPDNTLGAQMVITRKSLKQTGQGLENAVFAAGACVRYGARARASAGSSRSRPRTPPARWAARRSPRPPPPPVRRSWATSPTPIRSRA